MLGRGRNTWELSIRFNKAHTLFTIPSQFSHYWVPVVKEVGQYSQFETITNDMCIRKGNCIGGYLFLYNNSILIQRKSKSNDDDSVIRLMT